MKGRPAAAALAAASLCFASAVPARAARPLKPDAPEFPPNVAWVNSVAFRLDMLRGRRVVLLAFMNASSINSIRSFGKLKEWWDRYGLEGLMIIGVHSPDFDFDRDPLQVRAAVASYGLKFPVMIDTKHLVRKAYGATGWPALFLVDDKGRIVFDRIGEGGYAEFEREILAALDEFNGYRPPKGFAVAKDPERIDCDTTTKPFYLGKRRGTAPGRAADSMSGTLLASRSGEIAVQGTWEMEENTLRYAGRQNGFEDHFRLIYQGAECLATLSRYGEKPVRVFLKQDGLWLHPGNANIDVKWDDEDRSFVLVDKPGLYYLTKDKRKERLHTLSLFPTEIGIGLSSFEFSDQCGTDYERR